MPLINVRVAAISDEAEDVRSFLLAKSGPFRLPRFEAGAHIDVHCGEGIIRQYSLCGDPDDRRHYRIAVKRVVPSRGGSDLMHDAVRVGDWLEIGSPRNNFPLDETASHSVLLAGGIGITPIIAMTDRLHKIGASFEMHLFSRGEGHTAFRDRLAAGPYANRVTLHEGRDIASTQARLMTILNHPKEGACVYICGPGPFMDMTQNIAGAHYPADAMRLERFAANPALAGTPTHAFQIELSRSGVTLNVGADETILEVLERHDIDAAFSCEQGVCGTCVTQVIEGEPDHRDSFLNDKAKAKGERICLCVSRAKGARLVLDL